MKDAIATAWNWTTEPMSVILNMHYVSGSRGYLVSMAGISPSEGVNVETCRVLIYLKMRYSWLRPSYVYVGWPWREKEETGGGLSMIWRGVNLQPEEEVWV